jgi:ketosteroid isomerase-like protein
MSEQVNKATVLGWIASINEGDTAAFRGSYTDDGMHEIPGTSFMSGVLTADQATAGIAAVQALTKDGLAMTVLNITAEGDRVSAEVQGQSQLVNGSSYNNLYHFLFKLRDGKIEYAKEFVDTKLVEDNLKPAWESSGLTI